MHAIRINPETFDKIAQSDLLTRVDLDMVEHLFLHKDYVFITGYVVRSGGVEDWRIMPFFVFRDYFDYDADKIQHDWDLVVHNSREGDKPRNPYKE